MHAGGKTMRLLGIDPGLATIGYGVVDYDKRRLETVDYGIISTPAGLKLPERLDIIYDNMTRLMERFAPDSVAFEELFFAKNVKTGIAVAHARGVLLTAAYRKNRNLYEYTPLQVKQAVVGYGRADKQQVQIMVKTILKLDRIPKPDDAADALALAITHAYSIAGTFKI